MKMTAMSMALALPSKTQLQHVSNAMNVSLLKAAMSTKGCLIMCMAHKMTCFHVSKMVGPSGIAKLYSLPRMSLLMVTPVVIGGK